MPDVSGMGIEFWCFTDDPSICIHPNVVYTPMLVPGDPVRSARLLKAMPHLFFPKYEVWIWMDASFEVKRGADLRWLAQVRSPIATFRHRLRSCLYREAEICVSEGLESLGVAVEQTACYRNLGYPEGAGLSETGLLVRKNTTPVREFNALWWREISTRSKRDQISFEFCARACGLVPARIGTVDENRWVRHRGHAR